MTIGMSEENKEVWEMKTVILIALAVIIIGGIVFMNIRGKKKNKLCGRHR